MLERLRSGLIDRYGDGTGSGIGAPAGMESEGFRRLDLR
jgi:hypothetical protein